MSVSIHPAHASVGHFTITAHRSLSDDGLRRILIVGGLIGAGFDLALFLAFGAVVGVITLFDLLFLGFALNLHQRGAQAREEIVVDASGVIVSEVPPNGEPRQIGHFPLIGIEVTSVKDPDGEIERLMLGTVHRRISIGQALLPTERRGFRDALLQCLREAGARPLHRQESRSTRSSAIAWH